MTQGRKRRRSKKHYPITFKKIVCAGPPPCITTIFAVPFFHLLSAQPTMIMFLMKKTLPALVYISPQIASQTLLNREVCEGARSYAQIKP